MHDISPHNDLHFIYIYFRTFYSICSYISPPPQLSLLSYLLPRIYQCVSSSKRSILPSISSKHLKYILLGSTMDTSFIHSPLCRIKDFETTVTFKNRLRVLEMHTALNHDYPTTYMNYWVQVPGTYSLLPTPTNVELMSTSPPLGTITA